LAQTAKVEHTGETKNQRQSAKGRLESVFHFLAASVEDRNLVIFLEQ
jgi:hypothetical protein